MGWLAKYGPPCLRLAKTLLYNFKIRKTLALPYTGDGSHASNNGILARQEQSFFRAARGVTFSSQSDSSRLSSMILCGRFSGSVLVGKALSGWGPSGGGFDGATIGGGGI